MSFKTSVVYKMSQEAKGQKLEMGNIYFKNVPVTFASVLSPQKKYNSEDTAYQLNLFIDAETNDKVNEIGLNKEMAEVGVTKIKKGSNRGNLKYPLDEHNKDYEGMFAAQFSRNTIKRNKEGVQVKEYSPLKVVGPDGMPFTKNVGNGSICNVKMFAYRNTDDMLVVMLDTVVVVNHVPYDDNGGDYYDEELGITIKSSQESGPELDKELNPSNEDVPVDEKPKCVNTGNDGFDDDIPF